MARKPKEAKKDEFDELRDRFSKVADQWNDDRKRYKDDMNFLHVDHWPDVVRASRENNVTNPRLCLEIDQLSQYQRQVINDSRQNRPQIKVRPVDSKADIETAETYDGLCRHWQEASNADTAYDVALECATGGGFGFFRILHDYLHDGTFEQDFFFSQVSNPLQIYFGEHKEQDGSDAKECWIVEEIPKEEYEKEYPNTKTISWESESSKYGDWGGEKIRVAELYEIRKVPRTMHMLEDGSVCSDEEYQTAIANGAPAFPIKMSREIPKNVLYWSKFNGAEYIEQPREEPGDRIPVFPVWANVHNIDGKVIRTSMINKSKDAQLLYDYAQTAFAERVGQSPEAPWVAAEGQTANFESEWDGTKSVRVQHYTPVTLEGQVLPAPQRQNPSDIPAGFSQVMQQAEHGIQSSLGMYSASVGRKGNATSGVQEQEQARKGDVSSFHYHDNLARAIRSAGRYLISAAPKIIDTQRVARILGVDGKAKQVTLDPSQPKAANKVGQNTIFNIGVGRYDVAVDVGPSYQTSRQASAAGMLSLAQADPAMWQSHGDLIAEAQDWPEAQRFAKRSKLLLPPQIQAAEADQETSPEVQQVKMMAQQAIQQKDQILQHLQQQLQEMGTKLQQFENQKGAKDGELQLKANELQLKSRELALKELEAQKQTEDPQEKLDMEWKKALLSSETTITCAQISAKTSMDTALISAEHAANAEVEKTLMQGDSEGEGQVIQPKEKPKRPIDALTEMLGNHEQMLMGIHHSMNAPRIKRAKAVKQPDGSFMMESVELPQQDGMTN